MQDSRLFHFLQFALGQLQEYEGGFSDEEWKKLYALAVRQSLIGVFYAGIQRLPVDKRPPRQLLLRWSFQAETIKGMNALQNREAARLTALFAKEGRRTAVLKGQANARLYPDAFIRQPGDIDLWVDGGRESVEALLQKMNLLGAPSISKHHLELAKEGCEVPVEIHFKPAAGSRNPKSYRALMEFLEREILKSEMVPEGFYVPPLQFALVMQLSHIYQHFFGSGIGLRQLMDYSQLLRASTPEIRNEVSPLLRSMGLHHIAAALMWVEQEVFGIADEMLLCTPDARRGRVLLREVMEGGNFGNYAEKYRHSVFVRWLKDRVHAVRHLSFDFKEVLWCEIRYWIATVKLIPKRIRVGKLGLGGR